MENTKVLAVQNTAKSPIKRLFSTVNAKRKKLIISLSTMVTMAMMSAITAFAEGSSSSSLGNEGVEQFNNVIDFFATWIGRIGLVVGFVGAIMFALAIKNDDAEAKTRGLMTLAAGFVVFAVTKALDMFMEIA